MMQSSFLLKKYFACTVFALFLSVCIFLSTARVSCFSTLQKLPKQV